MGDSVLTQRWLHVENNWENPAAHEALLQQCALPEQLAEVARRYRQAASDPEKAKAAEAQLRRITALAMVQLEINREPSPSRPPYGKLLLVAFFLLGSAILASLL